MSFDLDALCDAISRHGPVARLLVADTSGSTPREAGAEMLVWEDGQHGTIGGGALEFQALATARKALRPGAPAGPWWRTLNRIPLGPALGQCCGGAVTLLTERFGPTEEVSLCQLAQSTTRVSRPLRSGPPLEAATHKKPGLTPKHLTEDIAPARPPIWIYGAGHVGRALVNLLPRLGFDITWVDCTESRFPADIPPGVTRLVAADPSRLVRYAPHDARHLVLTHSHALDLEICHQILAHGFHSAGLIGSATKWARFRARLGKLGHGSAQISRITCPIGQPDLGKSPTAIALGVACVLARESNTQQAMGAPAAELAM